MWSEATKKGEIFKCTLEDGKVKEVIIATDSDSEGETTALYLVKVLKKRKVEITRIAYGIPAGSSVEYADSITISQSFKGRRGV